MSRAKQSREFSAQFGISLFLVVCRSEQINIGIPQQKKLTEAVCIHLFAVGKQARPGIPSRT